ncbi:O-antigen ligase family protein [Luteibacter aegosomatis]|uniref:O-antigen ligase family protein n=1 Tax=Luteibacter aegosomatis TaxID=2911537 RepID=UPI001FF7DFCE|nr:O-antigen ligase family protein [Luteibacter aegosomatis]UPG86012.1 O-antigen ligase family protein [Luteibacter aegosomatis]
MTAAVTAADPRYTWRTVLLSALVAIIPIAVSVSWKAKALPMLALVVVGIVMMFRQADTRTRYRIVRAIVIVGLLRFAYAVFSIAWHGLGWGELDLPAQTLIFLCTAAAFTAMLDWRLIWTIFALTTCVLGGSCIVQHHLLGVERAYGTNGGDWSAIEFTMVTLCMVLFSIIRLIQPGVSRGERLLHALAIAIGAYGAILTQSRGPMLAFVPSLLVVVAVHVRRTGRWHGAALCVGVLVAGVITATTALNHQVMHRFGEVHGEISTFSEHNVAGPVRERLAMWEVAVQAFREHPLDGVGIDQFGSFTRELATQGDASPIIARYDHPHNEYLEAAATGGVPLLIITLLVFVLPAVHFIRRLGHPDEWTAMLATAGLALVVMYALSAFTDNVFYRAMPHSFYMYLVFGLALATALPTRVALAGRREATG